MERLLTAADVLARLEDGEYGPIQIPFADSLCLMRAAIDLHVESETVRFEFSNAVWNEDVNPATTFTLKRLFPTERFLSVVGSPGNEN